MINRILWVDFIKVVAAFSVVLLHVAAALVLKLGKIDYSDWMVGNVFDSIVRMSVPLFFMISGVLLLNGKEEPLATFFKKRLLKVVIPLMIWSAIYILFKIHVLEHNINFMDHIVLSFHRPEYWHLWFLYAIIGIYLVLPILKIFVNHASQNILIYFILLWIISIALIPFMNYFNVSAIRIHAPNKPIEVGYIGYLILGYLLAKIQIDKRLFYFSIVFMIVSTLGTIFGTSYLTEKFGKFIDFFYNFTSITTIIQAISCFIILKFIAETTLNKTSIISKGIKHISIASLGIYLIHPIYIYLLETLGINVFAHNAVVMVLIITVLTFILSFFTIYVIQNIKTPKYIPIAKLLAP